MGLENLSKESSDQPLAPVINHVNELEESLGVNFHHIPDSVYPGMAYTTTKELITSGITRYSRHSIKRLVDEGIIPGFTVAGRVLLTPQGVIELQRHEQMSQQGYLGPGGRKPGQTYRRNRR